MPNKRQSKEHVKKEYIKNLIKSSNEVLAGFRTPEEAKMHHANLWFDKYFLENNNYTAEQLLNPSRNSLEINESLSGMGNKKQIIGYNGLWRIYIHPRSSKSLDFDIAVKAGSKFRFHSKVIKHSIISRHGKDVYDQWRSIVKDDLESLRILVNEIRTHIKSIPWSYTCSQSSQNLCEQVGISTYRGTAFLFPSSYA
jgi:hypothetical protein